LTGTNYAQPADSQQNYFEQMLQSHTYQESQKRGTKNIWRSMWEGGHAAGSLAAELLFLPDIRTIWDVSDEQFEQIVDARFYSPEQRELQVELHALRNPEDPFFDNADEETKEKMFALQERIWLQQSEDAANAVNDTLTEEQKQIVGITMLASMGELPILSLDIFGVLNLTDAQRQQMAEIRKELKPEFENYLDEFVNSQMAMMNKLYAELARQGINRGDEDFLEKHGVIIKKLMAEDLEFKQIHEEIQSNVRAFMARFKIEMFDVLDDEQWTRLQGLIDNPPEHARNFIATLRKQMGVTEGNESEVWQPGPGSWRPGDAIPEAYRQERNRRGNFPRRENETKEEE
jgi:Ni/Co efflux regulator RcnB